MNKKLHSIRRVQLLHCKTQTVWNFIIQPENLEKITPPEMSFIVLTDVKDKKMYEGQIEITHIRDGEFFVDEQRFGPYKFWHHQHILKSTAEGVEMTDIVYYKMPFGLLGRLANSLLVKRKLERIFNFRYKKLDELFNRGK